MNENAKKWVEALESGEYEQGREALHEVNGDKYCCLGVACKLAVEAGIVKRFQQEELVAYGPDSYEQETAYLPIEVRDWLGLQTTMGRIDGGTSSLARMNDTGRTFAEIAARIREEPKGLFE